MALKYPQCWAPPPEILNQWGRAWASCFFKVVFQKHPVFPTLEPGLRTTELSEMAEELRELAEGNTCAPRAPWEGWANGEAGSAQGRKQPWP